MKKDYSRKIVTAFVIVFVLMAFMGILAIGKSVYYSTKEPEKVKGAVLEYLRSDAVILEKYGNNFDVSIESVSFTGEKGNRSAHVVCAISGNQYSLELSGEGPAWTVENIKSDLIPTSNTK